MLHGRRIAALLVVIAMYCLPQVGMAGNSLTCPVFAQSQTPETSDESGPGQESESGEGTESGQEEEEEEEPEC